MSGSLPGRLWCRLPVAVRAPVTAMLVLIVAVYPTSFLMQANLGIAPSVPWSVLPGALYLWLLWRYIGGWGPPAAAADRRARLRRWQPLPAAGRGWMWLAAISLGVTVAGFSMIKLQTETGGVQQLAMMDALGALPATTVLPLLAMLVLMTGFFEEAAFRGYMQVQLEERYRPAAAILLTAILFALVHFPDPRQLPLFVFGSLGWGVLTYLSGSILPAVVIHAAVDGVVFVWAWRNPESFRALVEHNVLVTGFDPLFVTWVAISVVGAAVTIVGFVRLARTSGRRGAART